MIGQDYRYLAILTMAVFLALGLGILLGGAVLGTDFLASQQDKAITQLTSELIRVRQSLTQMAAAQSTIAADLEAERTFSQSLEVPITTGRLAGTKVAVVLMGGDRLYGDCLKTLASAGGTVQSVTTIPRSAAVGGGASAALAGPKAMDVETLGSLVSGLAGGAEQDRLAIDALNKAGRIRFTGRAEARPDALVVFLENEAAGTDRTAMLLAEKASLAGVRVIVAAPAGEGQALLAAKRAGLSTVEGVDYAYGRVALVAALAGKAGSFGRGPASDTVVPVDVLLGEP